MKVIVINGAPRMERGNTHLVLTPFVRGLLSAGAEVDTVLLGRMTIKGCLGCFTCYVKTPGRCVHQDDMPELIDRIGEADFLVLATPVYIDGMTSLCKQFVDRLEVFHAPHFQEHHGLVLQTLRRRFPKGMALLSVCGYPGLHNFDPLVLHVQRMARNFHSRFVGAVLRPAVFSLLMKAKQPKRIAAVMDAVGRCGEELVRDGEISPASAEAAARDICTAEELVATANAYWEGELSRRAKPD